MQFAILNGERVEATPHIKAECPLCEKDVFSRCGEVNVHHWAHHKAEGCDAWYEPETMWHRNWKEVFGKENSERIITKDGKRHFADIYMKGKLVIELQNSPIPKPVIKEREEFYGEWMFWIINGTHFKSSFNIHIDYSNTGGKIREKLHYFWWTHPRRSWADARRFIFLDFGLDTLFWVQSGMGTNSGRGKFVTKERFISKYGGDVSLLSKVITSKETTFTF